MTPFKNTGPLDNPIRIAAQLHQVFVFNNVFRYETPGAENRHPQKLPASALVVCLLLKIRFRKGARHIWPRSNSKCPAAGSICVESEWKRAWPEPRSLSTLRCRLAKGRPDSKDKSTPDAVESVSSRQYSKLWFYAHRFHH